MANAVGLISIQRTKLYSIGLPQKLMVYYTYLCISRYHNPRTPDARKRKCSQSLVLESYESRCP